jgi:hypothetical protein
LFEEERLFQKFDPEKRVIPFSEKTRGLKLFHVCDKSEMLMWK